jgi:LemA protein
VKAVWIGVLVLAAVAVGAGREFGSLRNRLVREREEVNAAWLQVDSAFARRSDLVPGLVEAVKTFAEDRPPGDFLSVAEARSTLASGRTPQEKIAANERLSGALSRLLLLSENYPRLRSNRNFLRAQEEIANAENRIAVERRKYNETLEHYNSSIQVFPGNLVAALAGFTRNDAYVQTGPGAHGAKE